MVNIEHEIRALAEVFMEMDIPEARAHIRAAGMVGELLELAERWDAQAGDERRRVRAEALVGQPVGVAV